MLFLNSLLISRFAAVKAIGKSVLIALTLLVPCLMFGAERAAAELSGGGLPLLLPINVESIEIGGDFLSNGVPFSPDVLDGGQVELESATLDETTLGQSWSGQYGPSRLIAGRYRPQFSSFFEPATAPRANDMPFGDPVELEEDQILDLNVPAVLVQISFSLNGASFPTGRGGQADFYLRNVGTGREFFVGSSLDATNQFYVVPGVYDVIYAYRSGFSIPVNTHARILKDVLIEKETILDVDVPSVVRTFTYSLNGVPFPASGLDYGALTLEDPETGDSVSVGDTRSPEVVRVIPGTYQAVYSYRQAVQFAPRNPRAVVDPELKILSTGLTGVDINIVAHTVQPEFLLDGSSFPNGPGSGLANGRIHLDMGNLDMGSGNRFSLGITHQVPDPIVLIEGTYDAFFQVLQPNAAIPANVLTQFESGIVVDASLPMPLDVETEVLVLDVQLDGEPFPVSGLNYGHILLADRETGAEITLGRSYEGPFVLRVVRGKYDVVFNSRQAQGLTPINPHRVVERGVVVEERTSIVVNIETRLVAPRFSLDGAPFPSDASNYGEFYLRDLEGDEIELGASNVFSPNERIIQGAYTAEYEWRAGDVVPANHSEVVRIVSVPEPAFGAGLMLSIMALVCAGRRPSLARRIEGREAQGLFRSHGNFTQG